MAKIGELVSAVESILSGLKPTDDTRLSLSVIFFAIKNAHAEILGQYVEKMGMNSESAIAFYLDNSIFKESSFPIQKEGEKLFIDLPEKPISLPGGYGIRAIYFEDTDGAVKPIKPSSIFEIRASEFSYWPSPRSVLHGNRMRFYNVGGIETVNLLMIDVNFGLDENGEIDEESNYPIPSQFVMQTIRGAVALLQGAKNLPEDTVADYKDNALI